jgi:hypothetical protein
MEGRVRGERENWRRMEGYRGERKKEERLAWQ